MNKYKLIWEEKHETIIEADTEDQALEKWENGEYNTDETFEENTFGPEIYRQN